MEEIATFDGCFFHCKIYYFLKDALKIRKEYYKNNEI